jgi:hypothetical protein
MSLQAIRAVIEQPIIAAFGALAPPVPVYVENQLYVENDADTEFALVRLQWGLMNEPSIGCAPGELIRGVLIVELFTAKGAGPRRAQEAITPILSALTALGGRFQSGPAVAHVGRITGPSFTQLDGRPHLMTSLSAPVRGKYDAP